MQNFVKNGDTITYTNGTGSTISSGQPVFIGAANNVGVAFSDIADGATAELKTEGVFKFDKTTGVTISQGDILFWNTSTKKVTKTVTDKRIGVAHEAAASGDTSCLVEISGAEEGQGQAAYVAQLTDSSGGATANGTIEAITAGTPADLAAQAAINTLIRNAITELATTQNATLTALKNAGLMAGS